MTDTTPPKSRSQVSSASAGKAAREAGQTADPLHKIRVDVSANYVGEQSKPDEGHYAFSYTITIRNEGQVPARLLTRHWVITDANGKVKEVRGEGVVGEQPLLTPGQSHDYVSGCPLTTPFGSMEGFYTFERADGSPVEVRIPFFPLAAPETAEGRSPR